ncbi:MAG: hypothetical protein RR397_10455 [Odoribacter sp.]
MKPSLKIQILVDNPLSWFAKQLRELLIEKNHNTRIIHSEDEVEKGDILFLLSCEHLFGRLDLNAHNVVVHSSALPKGKGWAPISWQILEGKHIIPNTLFEATSEIDAGHIYCQNEICLEGYELNEEIRMKQGQAIIELAVEFVDQYNSLYPREQEGISTYYPRRTPKDSCLDPDKTIREQFNLLRICDNQRYPAYFELDGMKYYLRISKE